MPYYSTTETYFENIPEPSAEMVAEIQKATGVYLPQMMHCSRCRADAVGIIGEINSPEMMQKLAESAALPKNPEENRPYITVAPTEDPSLSRMTLVTRGNDDIIEQITAEDIKLKFESNKYNL